MIIEKKRGKLACLLGFRKEEGEYQLDAAGQERDGSLVGIRRGLR